jgi:hypothetical protein
MPDDSSPEKTDETPAGELGMDDIEIADLDTISGGQILAPGTSEPPPKKPPPPPPPSPWWPF